ncbi:MAG: transposase [Deltaproteobacteria bacterium]|nr:transposase [Deltaproteobacteria bacterium]
MDAKFQEGILCDLNRSVQDPDAFQCGACRPGLKVVGEPEGIEPLRSPQSKSPSGEARFQEEIRAQREKFTLALGRQRLESQPDEVFADLRYHLAWNVIYRRQAFGDGAEYSVFFRDVFREYSGSRGTFVALLWLCADHIHVYAECDVDRSVEDLGLGIKRFSEDAFLARFPDMKDRVFPEGDVWDPAYFVGTVG